MKLLTALKIGAAASATWLAVCPQLKARELDYLQDDSRFTGGETGGFDFENQYKSARNALQAAGFSLIPVGSVSLSAMEADSDAFYFPTPTDPTAATYPLTSTEISTVEQYVTSGDSVIFNLSGGVSQAMTNNLLSDLGLTGHEGPGNISGPTSYPMPDQDAIDGNDAGTIVGTQVNSYTATNVGYFDSLGTLHSLENVDGVSVLPYFDKGDSGSKGGAYFFILDPNFLLNEANNPASEQEMLLNLTNYAVQHWSSHFVPGTAPVPEPGSASLLLAAGASTLLRRRRRRIV